MPTLDQIGKALRAADAAGNVEDAKRLAQAYKQMRDSQQPASPDANHGEFASLITGQKPAPGIGQQIGRAFTMAGRNIAHGVMSIPGIINDPIVATLNYGEDKLGIDPKYRFGTAAQATDAALNTVGVPDYQPQNGTERVVGRVEQGMGGMLGGMGVGGMLAGTQNATAQGIGSALTSQPGAQLAATTAGTAAGGMAHEAGFSPGAELAVSLAGGVSPAALEAKSAGVTSAAARFLDKPDEQTSRLAALAQDAGIPLKVSQVSGSKVAKLLDSATGQVPLSGAAKFQGTQQQAFNRAVGKTIGANADAITPEVFAKAKRAIGSQFNQLTSRNNLFVDTDLVKRMNAIEADAGAYYGKEAQAMIKTIVGRIVHQSQDSTLPGRTYQSIDSALGRAIRAGGEKAVPLGDLRDAIRIAMDKSIKPGDAEAWAAARRQYRDLKTIEPLVAEGSANGGNISPAKLMGRVTSDKSGKSSVATGQRGKLADLAQIGQRFLKEQVPDSGTARRTAVLDSLKGMGTVAGSALGTGAAINPVAGLVTGSAAVAMSRQFQKMMRNPKLVSAMLARVDPEAKKSMLSLPSLSPELRQAIETSINPAAQSVAPKPAR